MIFKNHIFYRIILPAVLTVVTAVPSRANLADKLSGEIGFTISASTSIARTWKNLDEDGIRIKLYNNMSFKLDEDEGEASSWTGESVVVLSKRISVTPTAQLPQLRSITLYRLIINDEIYSAYSSR